MIARTKARITDLIMGPRIIRTTRTTRIMSTVAIISIGATANAGAALVPAVPLTEPSAQVCPVNVSVIQYTASKRC